MLSILPILLILLSCSKSESNASSLVGKWYNASLSTKITHGTSCDLFDTTKLYTKNVNASIYEFLSNGKLNLTLYSSGTSYTSQVDYKFENNKLTYTINGTSSPEIIISNLTADGWRYAQDQRSYCTSPYTKFTEYVNFKKY